MRSVVTMVSFGRSIAAFSAVLAALPLLGCPGGLPTPPEDLNPASRQFEVRYRYRTGEQPAAVAVADLNKDGRLDFVTANRGTDNLSVLLRQATGRFAAPVNYPAGSDPTALAVADVDNDTFLDVVAVNGGSDDIFIYINDRSGKLNEPLEEGLLTGAVPQGVVLVDLNEDGIPDIVTADSGTGTVSVLFGAGTGDFSLPVLGAVGDGPRALITTDLNEDGHADIVTANRDSNDVTLLLGTGEGGFETGVRLAMGTNPRMVAAADVNRDTVLDLITTNTGSKDISVRLGIAGSFGPQTRFSLSGIPTRFTVADFNQDNRLDIAALLFSDTDAPDALGVVEVVYGNGSGAFANARRFGAGVEALDITTAHLDTGGRPDLVIAETGDDAVAILYGRLGGTFETDERFIVGEGPAAMVPGDFDADTRTDLAILNLASDDVSLLLGNGDGTFEPERQIAVSGEPQALAAGRLNEDEHLDLVIADVDNSRVSILLGRGDGTFLAERLVSVRQSGNTAPAQPRSVALGDVDGDGRLDIVTGNSNSDSIAVLEGNGDGTFDPAQEFFIGNFPLDVKLADLNGDDDLDAVVVNGSDPESQQAAPPRVNTLFGNGDGTFDEDSRAAYVTGNLPHRLLVADLNNDGDFDLITTHQTGSQIYLLVGDDDGSFATSRPITIGGRPNAATAANLDGNSFLDLVVTDETGGVHVLENRGSLTFARPVTYKTGARPIAPIAGRFNGDNTLDMAVVNQGSDDVSVLLGD